ncbi:peptidylprolyl isomerase [Oceaniglobus indicus]|uniref:peptidylprolyl isomerase n=1 Tax=Oceaniglobus indicus TaxID=2047749 RepID=UPI000C17C807|nr:peptidylprolyl isomerase [Oceaniglobus indicus]
MNTFRSLALAGTVLAGLAAPLAAQDTPPSPATVVATVNGTEITLGHMIAMQQRLPEQYRQLPDDVLFNGLLEQLIQQTALGQSADGPSARGELILENERRALIAGEVIEKTANSDVSDDEIQAAYDAAFADAPTGVEWNARHILVETEDEAKELVTALEGGADFAELAKEKSTGPSGPNGGELGWFSEGMMVPEFENAVKEMSVGAISEPVKTQFGWHVLKLEDSRQKEAPSLEDVREQLTDEVRQQKIEALVAEVTDAADVTRVEPGKIDPATIRDASILNQ